MTLSVLSALARLDIDPWREARSLARMPREAAVERLTALINALPRVAAGGARAADLVALLPTGRSAGILTSVGAIGSASGSAEARRTPMLIGLIALLAIMLIVFTISSYSRGSDVGANPPPPRADAATMAPPKPGR